ncbi:unnamed protein product [Linum trigynum]|uniref:Uncharacterized protein n=1 Tax=Linum trigynum TaxID=586398 RepID=A0AAV2CBV3_9ROSI
MRKEDKTQTTKDTKTKIWRMLAKQAIEGTRLIKKWINLVVDEADNRSRSLQPKRRRDVRGQKKNSGPLKNMLLFTLNQAILLRYSGTGF